MVYAIFGKNTQSRKADMRERIFMNRAYKEPSDCVLIVSSSQKTFDLLKDVLSGERFSDIYTAESAGEAKRMLLDRDFDIVIVNTPLSDDFGLEFATDITENSHTGVLLLVKNDYYEQISYSAMQCGIYTVPKPTNKFLLIDAIRLICATNKRLRRLEKKTAALSAKMEEIRLVNHAKWTLITALGLTEEEAHRVIEKEAMDARITKGEVARRIIKKYESINV